MQKIELDAFLGVNPPQNNMLVIGVIGLALIVLWKLFFTRKVLDNNHVVKRAKPSSWLLGNLPDFRNEKFLTTMQTFPRLYGKVVEFYLGPTRCILVTDAELGKECLFKRPKKFMRLSQMNYSAKQLQLTNGLFQSEGVLWYRLRKAVAPSFSLLNIANKFSLLAEEMQSWMDRIQSNIDINQQPINMNYESFAVTIRIISVFTFGLRSDHPITKYFFSPQFPVDVQIIFQFMIQSALFVLPRWLWSWTPYYYRYEAPAVKTIKQLRSKCSEVLAFKRQFLQDHHITTPQCMIESLLLNQDSSDKALTDEELVTNMITAFIAGSDSSGITISWAVYHLCLFPDYFQKVREESKSWLFHNTPVQSFTGVTRDRLLQDITIENVRKMKFSHAFVTETLRLRSSAPALAFDVVEDVTFSNQVKLTAGDLFWVNLEGIHRDEDIFTDPEVFRPERWLTEDAKVLTVMEDNFLPFGQGSRICPGMNLAIAEAVLAIGFLCYHFQMKLACPVEEIRREINFTARPNKLPIQFTRFYDDNVE